MKNRRIVLADYMTGYPEPTHFRLEEVEVTPPGEGQVLVRHAFIGIDAGMRPRLSGDPGARAAIHKGGLLGGSAVGQVVQSRHKGFTEGDWVYGLGLGWQEIGLLDGSALRPITDIGLPMSIYLGALGESGLTAYFGLLDIGEPQPGETVLVSSAAGAVGSAAGQIAMIKGARAVGIAGGPDKCRWLVEELGFAAAIDRHAEPDLAAAVKWCCPDGVDILFDNVGSTVIDPVLPLMAQRGRIVCSGRVGDTNRPDAERRGLINTGYFVTSRLKMQGLIQGDYAARHGEALREMAGWVLSGQLRYREDIAEGLEQAPAAFMGLFRGENLGRQVVRI